MNSVFLVSRLNHFYFTISSSCHAECEEPGFAGSVFLLNSLSPHVIPVSEERAVIASLQLLAVLQLAEPSMLFPCCLMFNLPKAKSCVKLGLKFVPQTSSSTSPLPWEVDSWKSGILQKLIAHRAKVSESKGNRSNPCEIPHVNFSAGGARCY